MDGGSGRRGRRPLRPAGDGGTARRGRRALRVVAGRSHQSPGQRLAKRKARKEQLVKFGLCPMTSERSTAYWVRKSDESPARALVGAASTEQNGLEPHPAAREGASRARNCAAKSVFSFDGSTAVFFLARQKENGSGKLPGMPGTLGRSTGPRRRGAPRVWLPPAKFRNGIWGVSHGHPALRGVTGGARRRWGGESQVFTNF